MTFPSATPEISAGPPRDLRERVRQRVGIGELLTFRIGREWFALELDAVTEVVEAPEVRPVPEAPDALLGVFTLRDELIPLFSGAHVLGAGADGEGGALVLGAGRGLALAIDDVDDVLRVPLSEIREPPRGTADDEVLAGLVWRDGRLIAVLHARALAALCLASHQEAA